MPTGPITYDNNNTDSFVVKIAPDENAGTNESTGGALLLDNTLSNAPALNVYSNQNTQANNAALVRITAKNSGFSQPALEIVQNGTSGNAVSVRLKGTSPQVEYVETDQTSPAGKFELQVQGDIFKINGRNAADGAFETIVQVQRVADNGEFRHLGSALGFYGAASVTKPTVTGSRGGNAALQSLLTALANLGLITNSTT